MRRSTPLGRYKPPHRPLHSHHHLAPIFAPVSPDPIPSTDFHSPGNLWGGNRTTKAMACGIEPQLALDKKTHAILQQGVSTVPPSLGSPPTPRNGAGGEGTKLGSGASGKQFLKFETWSTRASVTSAGAAHPSMRRQVTSEVKWEYCMPGVIVSEYCGWVSLGHWAQCGDY